MRRKLWSYLFRTGKEEFQNGRKLEAQAIKKVALEMLKKGTSIDFIAEVTYLISKEEIEKTRKTI